MPFAQLVIGPPGSGKSTYCDGMQQMLSALGRQTHVVNLDPANDNASYETALDVRDLINLEQAMDEDKLGPNGGVLYAFEEIEHNFDWLSDGLQAFGDDYILFDCPGQVELFTHHNALRNVLFKLQKMGYRVSQFGKMLTKLVVVHLIDSFAITQPSLYISTLLLALKSMLQLDLPQLNVLTKIDNLASYPPLPLSLAFYTEARSLQHIIPHLQNEWGTLPWNKEGSGREEKDNKYAALTEAIIDLVDDFGLVGFETLAIEDKNSVIQLVRAIDRAGGFAFGGDEGANETIWDVAASEHPHNHMDIRDVEERWLDRREEFDEIQEQMWRAEAEIEKRRRDNNADTPGQLES